MHLKLPPAGLEMGTFRVTGGNNIYRCIEAALKTGYRLIDTAAVYNNEEDIGKALAELLPKFNLKREDIFITSKLYVGSVAPSDLRHDKVEKAVMTSCTKLGTSYLDLYLIHWPGAAGVPGTDSINATLRSGVWAALTKLYQKNIVHAIGVSNYTVDHLKKLLSNDYGVKPAVNQVEIHPHYRQPELTAFCKEHNIYVQAYCSLGGSGQDALMKDPSVEAIARTLQRPAAQILLRWALQNNLLIIPKSLSPDRIRSNIELDFTIPEQEMKVLNNMSHQHKYAWDPLTIL
ncbi:Aldo-keto reductase AKR2E4 [Gryllus bimaculatus]|nr:Aldo-keto reductase AKR2E4 [Gryllus bimaculatus]